jgi:hypothetical protein
MNTFLTEFYSLMYRTHDDDFELAFNETGEQLIACSLSNAKDLVSLHQADFDYPLIIVRETQTIVG